jgi:hypothetical protein
MSPGGWGASEVRSETFRRPAIPEFPASRKVGGSVSLLPITGFDSYGRWFPKSQSLQLLREGNLIPLG